MRVHLFLPLGTSSSCFQCLMHVVTAAVHRDGSWNNCEKLIVNKERKEHEDIDSDLY